MKTEGTWKASSIPWKQCPGSSKPENLLESIHWMKTAREADRLPKKKVTTYNPNFGASYQSMKESK